MPGMELTAMIDALADAIGCPAENVIPILRAQAKKGDASTDRALVEEAYRNIDTIRKVTGR